MKIFWFVCLVAAFILTAKDAVASAGAAESALTYPRLIALLEAHQPSTVAEALQVLKSNYPSYLDNYTLVLRSMSLQGSDMTDPRAVIFSDDGKLVVTFNGRSDQRGYGRFEVMHFLEDQKRFEFREIKFLGEVEQAPKGGGHHGGGHHGASPGKGFEISEPNGVGQRCLHCHGSNPLPIYDSYPFWPDAYGSQAHTNPQLLSDVQKSEVEAYAKFVSSKDSHERYRALPALSFETITLMNSKFNSAVASAISEVAKAELSELPEVRSVIRDILAAFDASSVLQAGNIIALPHAPLQTQQLAELKKLSEYHQTKIVRYARNFAVDREILLQKLIEQSWPASEPNDSYPRAPDGPRSETAAGNIIPAISAATGIAPTESLLLWTYTQTKPADLYLLPILREQLGEQVGYFNSWSPIPGRRFIEFNQPQLAPAESGIEKSLDNLL